MKRRFFDVVLVLLLLLDAVCLALPIAGLMKVSWDYDAHGPEMTFNVYSSTNLVDWIFRTNTPDQNFIFSADQPAEFFHITATNALTGLESD